MFLDIGVGILIAMSTSAIFHIKLTFLMVLIAVIFSLGPDLDFAYIYLRKHNARDDYKHRDFIHFPLLYLPLGTALVFLLFGKIWATLFFLTSFFHFIHDSIAIGWGIKWLYPFSYKNIAFFYLYSRKLKYGLRKPLLIFDEKELPAIVAEHGDMDWVRNIYYKWHPIAIIEFLFFIISIIVLYLYAK